MKDDRAKLIAKIKALMAKTVHNGCTEAEAMSALTMAQSLMDAYEVTQADINEISKLSYTNRHMQGNLIRITQFVMVLQAGKAAGDGASFGRPVKGTGAVLRIGKG